MTLRALPSDEILSQPVMPDSELMRRGGRVIGTSREDRDIIAIRLGTGPLRVSLIGGCHADEPVGPETLSRLASFLLSLGVDNPLLSELTWSIVPHVNPDGRERNRCWSDLRIDTPGFGGRRDQAFDLAAYLRGSIREPPGEDIEFGFPGAAEDLEARPENLAVARFLRSGAPFHVHGSFHGMALAAGPWFLLESAWIDRTLDLRRNLRRRVEGLGLDPLDIDRRGEKGFQRIDEGFSTRPDSKAMRTFFLDRGEAQTAALFRPSSMEFVRDLGGDPLTFVTEMPLFLLPGAPQQAAAVRTQLESAAAGGDRSALQALADDLQLRAFPIGDQARLQLAFLEEALRAVSEA